MVTTTANVLVVWKDETMNHGEDLDEMPWPPYKHRVKRQWDTTLGTVLAVIAQDQADTPDPEPDDGPRARPPCSQSVPSRPEE